MANDFCQYLYNKDKVSESASPHECRIFGELVKTGEYADFFEKSVHCVASVSSENGKYELNSGIAKKCFFNCEAYELEGRVMNLANSFISGDLNKICEEEL